MAGEWDPDPCARRMMDAPDSTPSTGENVSDDPVVKCPFCAQRWVGEYDGLQERIDCPGCGERFPADTARLLQLTEDGQWWELLEVEVPEEIAACARSMAEWSDDDVEEILASALFVELEFAIPRVGAGDDPR